MSPIEILEAELNKYERALSRSMEEYSSGLITLETHEMHQSNLKDKIREYKLAIRILYSYL